MKKTFGYLLLASFILVLGACSRNNTYIPVIVPTDKGIAFVQKLNERRVFSAATINYGTSGTIYSTDTLSVYVLNDSTISFRNDSLHYKAYSIDTIHNTITLSLSQYAATAGGNINTANFTYYYSNDSISYYYQTKLKPTFTSGYEISMHTR